MADRLNVIALISGGKDSFYSLLHCLHNGHRVIALGNLYPVPESVNSQTPYDLNSLMYQTVGHRIIPYYEQILEIPLYRQPIVGHAIDVGITYEEEPSWRQLGLADSREQKDETESLTTLLHRIKVEHPTANAVSTGAILSTYQRTRIEAVASRLGLAALAYLWQYPLLPPGTSQSLLEDMSRVGLDARVVKVASGGLDEGFLWQSVASRQTRARLQSAMARFSDEADGAVLGEGGEYETLVIAGPGPLFKGRIEVPELSRVVVREDGGSAWLHIPDAQVVKSEVPTEGDKCTDISLRLPDILDPDFDALIELLNEEKAQGVFQSDILYSQEPLLAVPRGPGCVCKWTFTSQTALTIAEEAMGLINAIASRLESARLESTCIVSTILLLRSMQDFAIVNQMYAKLFPKPNPPARVTIACGASLQPNTNLKIYLTLLPSSSALKTKKALHVQSRSYWAPANIGPYSQATTMRIASADSDLAAVSIAGQIPLIPSTMQLPAAISMQNPAFDTVLSLQHLWRIGIATKVDWWTSIVAYLPCTNDSGSPSTQERVMMASHAWAQLHSRSAMAHEEDSAESAEPDLWRERYHAGLGGHRPNHQPKHILPNWSRVRNFGPRVDKSNAPDYRRSPPFFAVEVQELPRAAPIEWHAQLGIADGPEPIMLRRHATPEWALDQCMFGSHMQVTIAIGFAHDVAQINAHLDAARALLGAAAWLTDERRGAVVYQHESLSGMAHGSCDCVIPCSGLWNAAGKRLALILIYNTL
ncbi:hypothetical protein K3495_g274 [Podosphaera aphanis]|nr:hypothetical protein K3495_g274 [Podosphaera aphanis]